MRTKEDISIIGIGHLKVFVIFLLYIKVFVLFQKNVLARLTRNTIVTMYDVLLVLKRSEQTCLI